MNKKQVGLLLLGVIGGFVATVIALICSFEIKEWTALDLRSVLKNILIGLYIIAFIFTIFGLNLYFRQVKDEDKYLKEKGLSKEEIKNVKRNGKKLEKSFNRLSKSIGKAEKAGKWSSNK